ncbi:MAG: peptide chain release factor N(5)-glutamine methyltransferase [Bacteroidales bacterium]|nr:peptide chain release factor N(5)-glutamine methyltransferase [Bacteroidales bacterium]
MLLRDFLKEGSARLESLYPAPEAMNIMLMLCEERIGTSRYTHVVEPDFSIEDDALSGLKDDLDRLSSGEPIQYVLGCTEFCGLRFKVGPGVLIPRPETEILCMEAIKACSSKRNVRILDLCTGSGCIAWTMALKVPGASVVGVDISDEALSVAVSQDFSKELDESGAQAPKFIKADVLGDPSAIGEGGFDLILSNPPYIKESEKTLMRPNVLDHEPALALFVPDDDPLLFYRAIARWSRSLLAPGGMGITEINELLGTATSELFSDHGLTEVSIIKDFYGKDRFARYSSQAS